MYRTTESIHKVVRDEIYNYKPYMSSNAVETHKRNRVTDIIKYQEVNDGEVIDNWCTHLVKADYGVIIQ